MRYSLAGAALAAVGYAQTSYPEQTSAPLPFPGSTYPQFQNIADIKDGATSPPKYPSPWMAPPKGSNWTVAYQRARAFVNQLTLAEKVNLTTGVGWESDRCVGNTGSVPRLNMRGLCLQDSPLGVRDTDFNSAFPAGVNVAATWSRGLAYARGQAMGSEHRDKGVDVQLGPVAGPLGRAPEGGRGWEGFSPDPYLTGKLMAHTVNGIQDAGVIACSKHYIVNEQEHFRQLQPPYNTTDSISHNLDDTTMHELYLWPFADAVRAGTGSVMCSYNQINNSYGCQNSYTLNYLLKGELNFQGFIVSDWTGQHSGVGSALAGLDITMPGDVAFDTGTSFWGANLTIAVLNGTVPQWRVDDMATRIMAAWYYVGRDQHQVPVNFASWTTDTYGPAQYFAGENNELINQHVDVRGNGAHGALIREIGAKSVVLLKNTQLSKTTGQRALPLTGNEQLTAVIGEDAGANAYGPNGCGDRGCDNGTLAMGWGSGTANFPYLVTPLEAIQAHQVANYKAVEFVTDNGASSQIETLAGRSSVSLVFVNADSGEGYIGVDGNQGDRNNLTLWGNGDSLINRTSSNCNNTIVVVHSVGPVILDQWQKNPNVTAILWAGLPGEQSGNSLVDVLYGAVNPGGKLPFSIASNRTQYSTDLLYYPNAEVPQQSFTEGIFIDYRAFDRANTTPTYEFGYGLSYTTFNYSNLAITSHNIAKYTPVGGKTPPAPSTNTTASSNVTASYLFPPTIRKIVAFIYPYLNSTDLRSSSGDPNYAVPGFVPAGSNDSSPQPIPRAGGAPGGNPQLYDVAFTVTATITNTGKVAGEEVPQLYVSLGGSKDAVKVLRGFDRLSIQPGQSVTFTSDVTRKDLSNWDTVSQDWVVNNNTKTVWVGSSSRKLPLKATLPSFS